ncbi:hypothetical protein Q4F19_10270 [Sphingomonas sp. BIUV-7]|uniref:Uncharacterized protein n=1 Tax=Sphingomonas natans TaxID=3063330 RepID=A0ABT8YAA4_9SPHN|nr:hypothetical protein [Sphingomonas sp. BIUV-7]MDO6414763.1 hypothetical protein [Sphingomonas sp. BIUV-7]
MYSVLFALLATTTFMGRPATPPIESARAIVRPAPAGSEAADPGVSAVQARRTPGLKDPEIGESDATLDKLWVPLPCTRVGRRMVC